MPDQFSEQQPVGDTGRGWLAGWRRYVILGGTIVLMGGIGWIAWQLVNRQETPQPNTNSSNTTVNSSLSNRETFQRFPASTASDSDGDGLTDEEERTAQTNPQLADTDGDGLTDAEEITAYKTNPLQQDTDGDGHPDGEEVFDGFNPNGPGLLRDLPSAIQQLGNTNQS